MILKLCLEYLARILITPVAVKEWSSLWILFNCLVIRIKYKLVVISPAYKTVLSHFRLPANDKLDKSF